MINLPFGFTLLNALALAGLLSIIVPLVIHLLNPNRGKIVFIGNIDLINQGKNIRLLNLRLTQWLLLILRLLILIFLTLILASLVKNQEIKPPLGTHVFVSGDWLIHSSLEEKNSLMARYSDDQIFLLARNFPKLQQTGINRLVQDDKQKKPAFSIQSLFVELKEKNLFAESNIIYTTNQTSRHLERNIFSSANNSVKPKSATSKIEWKIKPIPANAIQNSLLNVRILYSPSRETDYQYLKLGLQTLSKLSKFKLEISQHTTLNLENSSQRLSKDQPDWIFWLSDQPIPLQVSQLVSSGAQVIMDSNIENQPISSRLTSVKIDHFENRFFHLLPKITNNHSTPIWSATDGSIALSSSALGKGTLYQFNSRFNPKWNDLTSSVKFPLILAELLKNTEKLEASQKISESEIKRYFYPHSTELVQSKSKQLSYQSLLIFIICLLWLAERLVSEWRRVKK